MWQMWNGNDIGLGMEKCQDIDKRKLEKAIYSKIFVSLSNGIFLQDEDSV